MKIRHALVSLAILVLGILGWALGHYLGQTGLKAQSGQAPPVSRPESVPIVPIPSDAGALHLPPSPPPVSGADSGPAKTAPIPPTPISEGTKGFIVVPIPGAPESVGSGEIIEVPSGSTEDLTPDNPAGKMEPCVTLQWVGPPAAKVGQAATFQIMVKNVSAIPVHQVIVRNRLPAGVTMTAAEPRPTGEGGTQMWELGTLQPRQEKRIDLQLLAETKGDLPCQAMVTFTGMSTARIAVREPKLSLKVAGPSQVLVGDPVTVSLTVKNPGDGVAEKVKVRALLPAGLENPRGKTIDFDIGNLAPNESRSLQVPCNTQGGGQQRVEATAMATGNLTAQDAAVVDVVSPSLDVAVIGRDMLYLDRKSTFTIKVTNPSVARANNVSVSDVLPPGFKFVAASDQGQHDASLRMVSWFIGDLAAGESKEVKVDLQAIVVGEHLQRASASAARGVTAETQMATRIEGVSALMMEVRGLDNPVEVNADTGYEVHVVNTGTKVETQLVIICTLPDKIELRDAAGPGGLKYTVIGRDVIFEPLPKLAPRADITFRINVRGTAPGDYHFRAQMKADGLTNPISKEEMTKVY